MAASRPPFSHDHGRRAGWLDGWIADILPLIHSIAASSVPLEVVRDVCAVAVWCAWKGQPQGRE